MKTVKSVTAHMISLVRDPNDPNKFMKSYDIELPAGTQIRDVKKGDSFEFEFNKGQGWIKALSLVDPLSE